MTDQYRACCVCFRQWTPVGGERKCPGCLGRLVVPNATKRTPKLDLAALPEPTEADLAAYLSEAADQ